MDSMMSLIEVASSTVAKQCEVITRMTHALATQGALSASQTNDLLEIQKTISKTIESQAITVQRLAESRAASKCDFGRAMPVTTFPRFSRMPPEIRKSVWEMTLPDARVFVPYENDQDQIALRQAYKPPAVRAACKEAWLVTEEKGRFAFGYKHTRIHRFWFNPSKDIVFVRYDEVSDDVEEAIKSARTQNIALQWYEFFSQRTCVSRMEWARDYLKCRKLIVTIRPQVMRSVEDIYCARLFKLLDRDYVFMSQNWKDDEDNDDDENDNEDEDDDDGGQQWATWAKLKKRLEKIQSNRLERQDRRLVFEGMELLFNKRT
ncbi:unnamed protein product [Colletotrichum noveboracense]|uniref:2EXR domain-containing protein n=1 Tax=Colletotrichum noveboracense TaxID=2664923 RepID=A0A9W4WEJ6_9PEZI|nr:hypothetical protein K456DRAFT_28054 [Colletotrichum gloeosporioides 23]KAJ0291370.1 hypothetical protein COL940_000563 [Colletotrichum noveboracense]CAI0646275.1 unnamed protein product [Colletotrichum noveboracense]